MMYMKRFFRLLGLFLASTMLCTACSPGATPDSDPAGDPAASGAAGNLIPSDTFPMFSNDIDYSRGGNIPESEDYFELFSTKGVPPYLYRYGLSRCRAGGGAAGGGRHL